jgi:hypothetical protein
MRNKMLLVGAIMLVALVSSAFAADVAGKWINEREGQQGPVQTIFNFKVEGATLTGTVSGRGGDTEISEGKVSGDDISFAVVRKMGEMEMKTLYKGKVAGDEIKFTVERQGGMGGPGGGMGGPGGGMGGPGGGMGAPPAGAGGPGGPGGPGAGGPPRGPQEMIAKRAK